MSFPLRAQNVSLEKLRTATLLRWKGKRICDFCDLIVPSFANGIRLNARERRETSLDGINFYFSRFYFLTRIKIKRRIIVDSLFFASSILQTFMYFDLKSIIR